MYFVDTELYIEGSLAENAIMGDNETIGDRTMEVDMMKNSDTTIKKTSMTKPR